MGCGGAGPGRAAGPPPAGWCGRREAPRRARRLKRGGWGAMGPPPATASWRLPRDLPTGRPLRLCNPLPGRPLARRWARGGGEGRAGAALKDGEEAALPGAAPSGGGGAGAGASRCGTGRRGERGGDSSTVRSPPPPPHPIVHFVP